MGSRSSTACNLRCGIGGTDESKPRPPTPRDDDPIRPSPEGHHLGRQQTPPARSGQEEGERWLVQGIPQPKGAIFGDYSTGLEVNFGAKHDKPPSAAEKKLWKAQDNERKKVRIQAHARARKEVEKVWGEASRDPSSHPYLVNKGIDQDFEDLRVSTKTRLSETTVCQEGMLLVPMRLDGELVALQRIYDDGKKLAWKDAPNFGAATLIGADRWDEVKNNRIYVCEGWATGWTIAQATKNVVVVAFSKDGLLPVTQRLQKQFSMAKFVIAADNDRWTTGQQKKGEPGIPNPGVIYARAAAEETGSALVIPDFEDLTGRPTDFDDLRMREGMEVVKAWLDPRMAKEAVTDPLETKAEQEAEAPGVDEPEWIRSAPFRCLGVDTSVYYYMTKAIGQVVGIPASGHTNEGRMMELSPNIAWWEQHFPSKRGIDWRLARGAVMSYCQLAGIYDPDRIRGRGCHRNDDGKLVMHLGDRLLPPHKAKYTAPETYDGENRIYPRARRLAGPAGSDPMTLVETRNLLTMFESRAWEDGAAGALLAGWTVLAPFCGWLQWRPHVWVTGPRGCGKSTIIDSMVKPLLGSMCLVSEGMTTEAGLRHHLKNDVLPVPLRRGRAILGASEATGAGHPPAPAVGELRDGKGPQRVRERAGDQLRGPVHVPAGVDLGRSPGRGRQEPGGRSPAPEPAEHGPERAPAGLDRLSEADAALHHPAGRTAAVGPHDEVGPVGRLRPPPRGVPIGHVDRPRGSARCRSVRDPHRRDVDPHGRHGSRRGASGCVDQGPGPHRLHGRRRG